MKVMLTIAETTGYLRCCIGNLPTARIDDYALTIFKPILLLIDAFWFDLGDQKPPWTGKILLQDAALASVKAQIFLNAQFIFSLSRCLLLQSAFVIFLESRGTRGDTSRVRVHVTVVLGFLWLRAS